MADKKSLSDLAALTNPQPEAPAAEDTAPVAAATEAPAATESEAKAAPDAAVNESLIFLDPPVKPRYQT